MRQMIHAFLLALLFTTSDAHSHYPICNVAEIFFLPSYATLFKLAVFPRCSLKFGLSPFRMFFHLSPVITSRVACLSVMHGSSKDVGKQSKCLTKTFLQISGS